MKHFFFPFFLLALMASGCIGDDIIFDEVEEAARITNPLDTLGVGEEYQFEGMFTNNIGVVEERAILWSSSDPTIVSVDENGLAMGLAKGMAEIKATVELEGKPSVEDINEIVIDEETVVSNISKSGMLTSTSSYNLKGGFTITENNGKLDIEFADDYEASTALPGLYVYLANNPSSINSALEIGKVEVFDGGHSYELDDIGINEYQYLLYWCKPFNVKVGEGVIE